MTTGTTASSSALVPSLETAWRDVDSSFERFCLTAGIATLSEIVVAGVILPRSAV